MIWTPDIAATTGPIYLAVADAIARGIEEGALAAGERLPSQRALADRLGVDLTTITRAYAEAARRGLVLNEDRRGSFVRGRAVTPATVDPTDEELATGMNMPPEPAGDLLRNAMRDSIPAVLDERSGAALHYRPRGGAEADRAAGAAFLARLIPGTTADQIVVAAGAQNALHAICGLLLRDGGGAIATGEFTYSGLLAVARRLGTVLVPLRMDREGILPDALETAAQRQAVRAVCLTPTNDNPTTATMSAGRRAAIAGIVERYGLILVEDDPYGRLPEAPLAPIASLVPERSWHIASLSKAVSPALRVAFVRAPSVRDALALAADIHETAIMAPPINVALVRHWIGDGMLARLIAAVRHEAAARRQMAVALIGADLHSQAEGYHLWLPLPEGVTAAGLMAHGLAAGLPVAAGSNFAVDGRGPAEALRIVLGGGRPRDRLVRDLRRLDAMLADASRPGHLLV